MAAPSGYQEPPSGPENIRKNFCSACGADVIRKIETITRAEMRQHFGFIVSPFEFRRLYELARLKSGLNVVMFKTRADKRLLFIKDHRIVRTWRYGNADSVI